jgi:hypothetical protein
VRGQHAIASTGPFAELMVDGKASGDTVVPNGGQVKVEMRVDAPSWIRLKSVRLYRNGILAHEYVVLPGHRPVFHQILREPVDGDSWFVLEADGSEPLPLDVVGEVSALNGYQMLPFVITNPVFVDAEGDGRWQPPTWAGPPPPFDHPVNPIKKDNEAHQSLRSGPVPEGCGPADLDAEPLDAEGAAIRALAKWAKP